MRVLFPAVLALSVGLVHAGSWVLVARDVAWGAEGNKHGEWAVSKKMCASQIKLVHQSGYVACRAGDRGISNYGCKGNTNINVHITDDNNPCGSCSIAPASDDGAVTGNRNGWWMKRGYTSESAEIILDLPRKNYCFDPDDTYHIWHGEDKNDNDGGDNHGIAKDNVYLYVEIPTTTITTTTATTATATTTTVTSKTATTTTTSTTTTVTTARPCQAGEYLDAASNECIECPSGTYQPDDGHVKTSCEKHKDKCSFREFIVSPGTKTSNIVCRTSEKCAEDEWESKKAEYGETERQCTPLTQCEAGQFISKRASSRSDQQCSECDSSYTARSGGCTTTTSTKTFTTKTRTTRTFTSKTSTTGTTSTATTTTTGTTITTTTTLNADQLAAIEISATWMKEELTLKGLSTNAQVDDLISRGFEAEDLVLAGYKKVDILAANVGISESEFAAAEADAAAKATDLITQAREDRTGLSELLLLVPKTNLDAVELLNAGFTEDELRDVGYSRREVSAAASAAASTAAGGNVPNAAASTTTVVVVVVVLVLLLAVAIGAITVFKKKGGSGGVASFENPMYDTTQSSNLGGNMGGNSNQEASYMDVNPLYSESGQESASGYMDVSGEAVEDRTGSEMARMEAEMGGFGGTSTGYMDVSPQQNNDGFDEDGSDEEEV